MCDCLAAAGAYVLVVGRSEEAGQARVKAIVDNGGAGEFFAADVTSADDIQKLLQHCIESNHYPDILINGAGINSPTPFLEISDEEWEKIFNVNLRSVRLACQIFAQQWLQDEKPAAIINIASMAAITPLSRVFTYSATKAAVLNLTKNLAREWAEQQIRVNAVSPGFFPAEQNRKVLTPERVESIMKHTPANR